MSTAIEEKIPRPARTGTGAIEGAERHGISNTSPGVNQARFDTATLDALRARLPEYLEATGHELRRQGARFVTHCPNHHDTNPSFAVFADGRACGCFPCGWKGDVFSFAEWTGRAASFPEAVRHVADVLNSPAIAALQSKPRPARKPAPPFALTDGERETIRLARLRFSDAFHDGEPIIDEIAESLAVPREALRWAAHGSDGLALAPGRHGRPEWLCYAYSTGLKYRNPNPAEKPRFDFLIGKASAPWRMAWAHKPEVETVFLTESESDALAIIATGIEADGRAAVVASPGTNFAREWAPMFAGKRVVLCYDRDKPGQAEAGRVAAMLTGHAAEIFKWKGTATHV